MNPKNLMDACKDEEDYSQRVYVGAALQATSIRAREERERKELMLQIIGPLRAYINVK